MTKTNTIKEELLFMEQRGFIKINELKNSLDYLNRYFEKEKHKVQQENEKKWLRLLDVISFKQAEEYIKNLHFGLNEYLLKLGLK